MHVIPIPAYHQNAPSGNLVEWLSKAQEIPNRTEANAQQDQGNHLQFESVEQEDDNITPLKEITLSCLRPVVPDGKITVFPRNSVRSKIAPTTTAVISSRTPPILGLSCVRSTSGAPANTTKKHGRNV